MVIRYSFVELLNYTGVKPEEIINAVKNYFCGCEITQVSNIRRISCYI